MVETARGFNLEGSPLILTVDCHFLPRSGLSMNLLEKNLNSLRSSAANLRRLFLLRCIAVAGQLAAIVAARSWLEVTLPLMPMLGIIGLIALFNGLTWLRLKFARNVSNLELLVQVLIDIVALTLLLYFSGGATNPFISLYLLPLAIAAVLLPRLQAEILALVTVLCYTWLLFHFQPLHYRGHHPGMNLAMAVNPFGMHILGMWLTFVLSAVLIVSFVSTMALSLRERDQLLSEAREETLRNERIIALGTLAAGAAHELGTPLGTMAVVVHEMRLDCGDNPELADSLQILSDQVGSCKRILTDLLATAGQTRGEGGNVMPVDAFLEAVVGKWQMMRPEVTVRIGQQGDRPAPKIIAEQTLGQAIMNLLNNAADASPAGVEVEGRWTAAELEIWICDQGPGFTQDALRKAGQMFFTTKREQGMGLGIFLSNATISRFGGQVSLANRDSGGACTRILIPLKQLQAV